MSWFRRSPKKAFGGFNEAPPEAPAAPATPPQPQPAPKKPAPKQ